MSKKMMSEAERKASLALMAVGLILLIPFLNGVLFVAADYWDHTYLESYRGYDIYYFPGPGGLYGIDVNGSNPHGSDRSWSFYTLLEQAYGGIDNWLDDPLFVEAYLSWEIYREPGGAQRYYAVDAAGEAVPGRHLALEGPGGLRAYLDTLYEEPEPSMWAVVWSSLSETPLPGLAFIALGAVLRWRKGIEGLL